MGDLEDGETWRRLNVTFPASITTHSPEQVFYFGADGLLRRLDYTTEVNADDRVAHYTEGYKTFDGLAFPTRRRVYRRNRDSTADRSVTPSRSISTTSPPPGLEEELQPGVTRPGGRSEASHSEGGKS
jgi:hypothetical protein